MSKNKKIMVVYFELIKVQLIFRPNFIKCHETCPKREKKTIFRQSRSLTFDLSTYPNAQSKCIRPFEQSISHYSTMKNGWDIQKSKLTGKAYIMIMIFKILTKLVSHFGAKIQSPKNEHVFLFID